MLRTWKTSITLVTLYRIACLLLLYQFGRLAFTLTNLEFFPELSLADYLHMSLGGFKFDMSAICYTNLLWISLSVLPFPFRYRKGYQAALFYIFMVVNSLAIIANVADMAYFKFTFRRTTSTIFTEFGNEQSGFLNILLSFLVDYWGLSLFAVVSIILLRYLYKRVGIKKPAVTSRLRHLLIHGGLLPVYVFFIIAGCRGTFVIPTFPINLSNALESVDRPLEAAVVLNTPFSVIRTIGKDDYDRKRYFQNQQELEAFFNPVLQFKNKPNAQGTQPKNVVYIIMESFGREYFGIGNKHLQDGNYQGYTPFLDSLLQHAYTFTNAYANGVKSIEGIPSVVSSIPSGKEPYFTYHHANNEITSIASLLAPKGYASSFFHGAPNGSLNFNAYAKNAGYQNYVGMTEYLEDGGTRDDYDGYWGLWDHKFLPYAARKMGELPQPFFASVFNLSSHSPYKVPAEFEGKLRTGPLPMHQAINYADHALRLFFNQAKTQEWFQNTLFVFTADHSSRGVMPEFRTSLGRFAITIAFYDPSNPELKKLDQQTVVQQTDITPTVLNMLGYNGQCIAFGNDIFDPTKPRFAYNCNSGVFQLINDSLMLQYNETETVGLYRYKDDKALQNNLVGKLPAAQLHLEQQIKAILQQYNNRMLDNQLVIK